MNYSKLIYQQNWEQREHLKNLKWEHLQNVPTVLGSKQAAEITDVYIESSINSTVRSLWKSQTRSLNRLSGMRAAVFYGR